MQLNTTWLNPARVIASILIAASSVVVSAQPADTPATTPAAEAVPAPKLVKPAPTFADLPYGPHERNVMDVWLAPSDSPTPLLVAIHGGGF